jgi:gamma-glutamyl:cysteine ligase YbdK (ATP-grasp superfamily)
MRSTTIFGVEVELFVTSKNGMELVRRNEKNSGKPSRKVRPRQSTPSISIIRPLMSVSFLIVAIGIAS